MIVHDLDVRRVRLAIGPLEADSPLLVDADAVLPPPIALESFKTIARQPHERLLARCSLQDLESPISLALERLELPDSLTGGKALGAPIAIPGWWLGRRTHRHIVTQSTRYV